MLLKRFQNYFGNMNLQKRLLSYFIIVCIIPLIIVGSIAIFQSLRSTQDFAVEFADSTLLQIKTRIENIMTTSESVSSHLTKDQTIQDALIETHHVGVPADPQQVATINAYLNYAISYSQEIYGFYVIGNNYQNYKSNALPFRADSFDNASWYQTLKFTKKPIWFTTHRDSFAVNSGGQTFISRGMLIQSSTDNKFLGVVLIDIELQHIERILDDSFGQLGHVIIVDDKNHIVASSNTLSSIKESTIQDAIESTDSEEKSFINNNRSVIISYPLYTSHWRIIGIVPQSTLYKDSIVTISSLIALVIIISIFAYIFSKIITSTISTPINHMIEQMKKVESGNLSVPAKVHYNDEIGNLSRSFNKMTLTVQTLLDQSVKEQEQLRKSELKALQSQINPHFLYNTLDSVVWLARLQQHEDIINIVTSMTTLFRISLSRGKDIITIEDEMEHISSYLKIQKYRYRTHFQYTIDVPTDIYNYKTLKLLLQPLVENAIYHGIKLKREGGLISITASIEENNLVFLVSDTGLGMTPEALEDLHNALESKTDSSTTTYGAKNVHERIKIFFGDAYGLKYESTLGVGTTAILTIPKYEGDDANVKNSHYR